MSVHSVIWPWALMNHWTKSRVALGTSVALGRIVLATHHRSRKRMSLVSVSFFSAVARPSTEPHLALRRSVGLRTWTPWAKTTGVEDEKGSLKREGGAKISIPTGGSLR